MTTRVETLGSNPTISEGTTVTNQWPPESIRREATPTPPQIMAPEVIEQAQDIESRAIEILEGYFLTSGVVNHPSPDALQPHVKIEIVKNVEFNRKVTRHTDRRLGRHASATEIEQMVDDMCAVALPRAYLRGLSKQILSHTAPFDSGHRNALNGIQERVAESGVYKPEYGALNAIVTSSIGNAIDSMDVVALKTLCEVNDILRPKFDHPCNAALAKALDATVQIIEGKDKTPAVHATPGDNSRRSLVTDVEFSSIFSSLCMSPEQESLDVLPVTVHNYQSIGAKINNLVNSLKDAAPADTELHSQCDKLIGSLRLNHVNDFKAYSRYVEKPDEPILPVVTADLDATGRIIGSHTDFMPEKIIREKKWSEYVVAPVVTLATIAAGLAGISQIGDHLKPDDKTPSSSAEAAGGKDASPNLEAGSPSPEALDHSADPIEAPVEPPVVVGAQPLGAGETGTTEAQDHTHHTQASQDDFSHIGHLPEAGPEVGEQIHYGNGGNVTAEQANLENNLEHGTLTDAIQATIKRFAATTSHGHNFERPPTRYITNATIQAKRLDAKLKNRLNSKDIDLETYLAKRALLADSVAMLLSPGVSAHVHDLVAALPPASADAVESVTDDSKLRNWQNQPSYPFVTALLANTLDTVNAAAEPPEAPAAAEHAEAGNSSEANGQGQQGDHGSGTGTSGGTDSNQSAESESSHESDNAGNYDALLNLIAGPESGGNYNAYYGHADNKSIDFTSMSVTEVINWQTDFRASGKASTAVGKYQILQKTLIGLMEQYKLSYDSKFDKEFTGRTSSPFDGKSKPKGLLERQHQCRSIRP